MISNNKIQHNVPCKFVKLSNPTHLRADRPILPLLPPGDRLVEKEDLGLVEVPRPEFRPQDP